MHETEMLPVLQVAVLTCHEDIALPLFAALRHLTMSSAGLAELPIATLSNATSLETLSLGIFGDYADWFDSDLDVSSLHALKHVGIEKFAPRKLQAPDSCLLHVVWNEERTDANRFRR